MSLVYMSLLTFIRYTGELDILSVYEFNSSNCTDIRSRGCQCNTSAFGSNAHQLAEYVFPFLPVPAPDSHICKLNYRIQFTFVLIRKLFCGYFTCYTWHLGHEYVF